MADVESNINIDINTSDALASLRTLQREISNFHQVMSKTGAVSNAKLADMQNNLINGINSTGKFTATLQRVTTTTESFTNALEKNKLSMGQYFRYAAGSTKTFGRLFRTEFDTIEKVSRERVKTLQTQYIKLGRDASGAMKAIAVRPQVLDMQNLGTQTAIAAQKAQLFNQLMKQGSTDLLNFGKNTQWAGRQLMVGFTIPLGIMGAAAAKEFKAIEEQVLRLERVYGDFTTTMADTEKITEQIKTLASEFTKYGVSVAKTMGLAADAAAMGKTGADLIAQVSEANRLAVLGGVTQEQSLETTISLTNSFGIAADKLSGKINFLNAVENQTVTSIEDLTEAIPKAGPVVQQLGGTVEDLTFFLTAMKEGGIDASEGANALKSGLASLINPTGEAVDMLNQFGINIEAIRDKNAGDVTGMVLEFAHALETLDPLQKAQAIETMFGKFQFARMSTLFQNVIAEGSQASRVLDLTKQSAAELAVLSQRELSRISASPLYQFQGAIEDFKAALAPVGETFMQVVTPIIKFGTDILNKFNEMDSGAKQFLLTIVGAVAGIGPVLLMTFGLVANGVANLIKGFMLVKNVFTGTGSASSLLAEQTQYMTNEQLEAAAVASSLGQVHTKLTQTFNAETAAVRELAAAYGSAVAQQGAFMGPITTRGGGTKKAKGFASGGIFSGPGTGTSDSIIARVSNGEAIIPAATVKKFPDLINGLISGNIPGFAKGDIINELRRKNRGAPQAIIDSISPEDYMFESLTEEEDAFIAALRREGAAEGLSQAEIDKQIENLTGRITGKQRLDRSHIGKTTTEYNVGGSPMAMKDWRTQDIQVDQRGVNQILANLQEMTSEPGAGKGSYLKSLDPKVLAGIAGVDPKNQKAMKEFTAAVEDLANGGHPTSRAGYQAYQAMTQYTAENTTGNSKQARGRRVRMKAASEHAKFRLADTGPGSYIAELEAGRMSPKADEAANKKAKEQQEAAVTNANARIAAEKGEQAKVEKKTTKTAKKRQKAEEVVAKSESEKAKAATAAKRDPRQAFEVMENGRYRDPVTNRFISTEEGKRREKNKARRDARAAQKAAGAQTAAQPSKSARGSRAAGFVGKAGIGGMVASGALQGASMMGGPLGDVAGSIAGPLFAVSGIVQVLQMFPGVLAAMTGPIGLVVAGVAALGIGLYAMHDQLQKTRESAREAAGAVSVGNTAMQKFAEATGRVSATEQLQQRRQSAIAPTEGGSNEFGTAYLESEAGKAMKSGMQAAIKDLGTSEASKQFGLQLGTAVASNILTADEATQIAAVLGEQLGNESITIGLVGQLESIIGPNGQDLKNSPMDVKTNLIAQTSKSAMGTLADIADTGMAAWGSEDWNDMVAAEQRAGMELGAMREQGQLLIDDLQLQHEARLENLKAAGDLLGIEKENKTYAEDRKKLEDETRKASSAWLKEFKKAPMANQNAIIASAAKSVEETYAGTDSEAASKDAMKALESKKTVTSRGGSVTKNDFDNETRMILTTDIQAGNISPEQFVELTKFMDPEKNAGSYKKLATISTELGGPAAGVMAKLLPQLGDEATAKKIIASIDTENPEEANKLINAYDKLQTIAGQDGIDLIVRASTDEDAADTIDRLGESYAAIDKLVDGTGPITFQAITDLDLPGFGMLSGMENYFAGLDPLSTKTYLQKYVTMYETVTDKDVSAWYAKQNKLSGTAMLRREESGRLPTMAQMRAQYANWAGQNAVTAMNLNNNRTPAPPPPSSAFSGGGGGSSQPDLPTEAERYNAALALISDQEDEINKKYNARLEALAEIEKAEQAIAEQQRDQLDLADALTRGDISAAARAMQTMRANEAKRAREQQKEALEKAREAELAKASYGGYTRGWYEAQIQRIENAENARVAAGQARANGGYISGPGTGTSDSIPAMLSNGEYVIRAAAVRAFGIDNLNAINGMNIGAFAKGGLAASQARARANKMAAMVSAARERARFASSPAAPAFGSMPASKTPAPRDMVTQAPARAASPTASNQSNSVYNYSVNVNSGSGTNPNQIAAAVMKQIRNLEASKVRRNYISG